MKKLIILAMLLTGCADQQRAHEISRQFIADYNAAQQARVNQQFNPNVTGVTQQRQDFQCFQNCTQAGYQYGLCQSRCSY
jgi:hypothetical protein